MIDSLIGPTQTGGAVLERPAAPPAPAATTPSPEVDPKVANSPPIQAVLAGNPPAVWADTENPGAGAVFIAQNLPSFGQLGLGLYRAPDKAVLFNQQVLSPEQVKQMDASGELDSVAPPIESFFPNLPTEAQASEGTMPSPDAAVAPEAVSGAAGGIPAGLPGGIPPAAPKATAMRLEQLQPKAPSQRPAPGQGLVLNGLLRRAA